MFAVAAASASLLALAGVVGACAAYFDHSSAKRRDVERATLLHPFPAGSLWANSPLPRRPRVAKDSASKIQRWMSEIHHPSLSLHFYATATAISQATDPKFKVVCVIYDCPQLTRAGPVHIPTGTEPDPSPDGHLALLDPVRHREWDLWAAKCCWSAGNGGTYSTLSRHPWTAKSGRASGIPLLAGIVHPEEIAAGRIDHPLVFGSPDVGVGHVCPASQDDGGNSDPSALKEGSLLQLDPRVNIDKLRIPRWQKTVARALKRYGMYLVDNSGALAIVGENPINRGYDAWARVGITGEYGAFSPRFPWNQMHLLRPPRPWCGRR